MIKSQPFGTHPFGKYDVLQSCTLQCTDMMNGSNKFYLMEIHKDDSLRYRVFSCYGRTGKTAIKEERIPNSLIAAEQEFRSIKNKKIAKGYREVEMVTTSVGSDVGNSKILSEDFKKEKVVIGDASSSSPKLPPAICSLVEQLYELSGNSCRNQLSGTLNSTTTNPLGTLTLNQLSEGKNILAQINTYLSSNPSFIGTVTQEIIKYTDMFYCAIPQNVPLRPRCADKKEEERQRAEWIQSTVLNNPKILDEKYNLIELLEDVQGMITGFNTTNIQEKYDQMNCLVEQSTKTEFEKIKHFVESTQSSTHNWTLSVQNVYRISCKEQNRNPEFMKPIGNFKPLFHGSGCSNILGICKKGLLMRPPGVYITGSMFGNGLYFADVSTKSSQYSTGRFNPTKRTPSYFMFVADVALGRIKEYTNSQTHLREPPRGYHSVMGKAGNSLIHNEYIIYNIRQNVLNYLVEFTMNHRRF